MRSMTSDRIIAELGAWQDRLAVISRNLGEINELPALLRIKARLRATPDLYAGETASRIGDALAALDELWKDYLLLNALIDQAETLRKRAGLFHHHDAEIEQLLHGRSIVLPPAHVPLADRGLLTTSQRADKATPEELLAAMEAIFKIAKDTILALDAAEVRLRPKIEALAGEARTLAARANDLGAGSDDIVATAARLDGLGAGLVADPLGAERQIDEAGAVLADWRTRIEAEERARDALRAGVVAARKSLGELQDLSRQARAAHGASVAKVAMSGLPPPTDVSVIAQFGTWLDALDATTRTPGWRTAQAGLDKWTASCLAHQVEERRIVAANTAPLAARDELRGRLKALRAKAMARSARGLRIDPATTRWADEAEDTLYRQPADLAKAAHLLAAYEAAIEQEHTPIKHDRDVL
jgi:hypothetical protein